MNFKDEEELQKEGVETTDENQNQPVDNSENCAEIVVENKELLEEEEILVQNIENSVEEQVCSVENSLEETNIVVPKKGSKVGILLGILAFIGILAYCWMTLDGGIKKTPDIGVAYAKDNGLYVYDLKNEPYLVNESVSNGGSYHYYYTAWGTQFMENQEGLYFLAETDENELSNLYYQEFDKEPILIGEKVVDFTISVNGETCVYFVMDGENVSLYRYTKGGESICLADKGVPLEGGIQITDDGADVYYMLEEEGIVSLYVTGESSGGQPFEIASSVGMHIIDGETREGYYIQQEEESTNLMGHSPEIDGIKVIAEDILAMQGFEDKKSLLYAVAKEDKIPYSQVIVDDIEDISIYEEEKQENIEEIRKQMKEEEGIDSLFQDYYLLSQGEQTKIEKNSISMVPLDGQEGYFVGYHLEGIEPINLSAIESLEDGVYQYYLKMIEAKQTVFLGDIYGNLYDLKGENINPITVQVSEDKTKVIYLCNDPITQETTLMMEALHTDTSPIEIATTVETMAFMGDQVLYFHKYNELLGSGTLSIYEDGQSREISEDTAGVHYAPEIGMVYYISNMNKTTGNGDFNRFDGKNSIVIDKDVFSFQHKGNGKISYIKNYTMEEEVGDLYYYDGKESIPLDKGITAIYMY